MFMKYIWKKVNTNPSAASMDAVSTRIASILPYKIAD